MDEKEITSIHQLADIYDIRIDEEDMDDTLKDLKFACEDGKISFDNEENENEYPLLCVTLNKPAKMSSGDNENDIQFKPLTGSDRKIIQNTKDDKRGNAIQKIICRKTGISIAGLEKHNSNDVGLLESIFTFFC